MRGPGLAHLGEAYGMVSVDSAERSRGRKDSPPGVHDI